VGIDADDENLRLCKARLAPFGDRVRLFQANFADLPEVMGAAGVSAADVLLADLGVSSNQLDDPARGLSFLADGPLDMRLNRRIATTAADLVNGLPESELADLIYACGEERYSRRIARRIAEARKRKPIERTLELAGLVVAAYPRAAGRTRRGAHPATRTFQALRIAVNDELASLERLLSLLPNVLAVGGRAAVISFHSLEDRRVKQSFAQWATAGGAKLLNRRVIRPGRQELAANPRSRSAKLRAVQRVA
jgi:16S rRNA (cytosine1402-N4)-methyltransferase